MHGDLLHKSAEDRSGRSRPPSVLPRSVTAILGLHAPLLCYVDLRELLALPLDEGYVRARAEALGLSRALHGATLLVAHFFPQAADAAARMVVAPYPRERTRSPEPP